MLVEVDLSSIVADMQHGGSQGDAGAGDGDRVGGIVNNHDHQHGMNVEIFGSHGSDVMVRNRLYKRVL